jgi:nucleoside-diphosphate-sugar epimerase
MTAPRALVIGGTGPTGPFVVEGLAERGYQVTILHGGQHEVDFAVPGVAHIHADPHFAETLEPAVAGLTFDLVVAQYGRLRVIADVFANKTDRFIGVGAATAFYALPDDPRWGAYGRPAIIPDTCDLFLTSPEQGKLQFRMAQTVQRVLEHHAAGSFSATYIGYPNNYGPRQPGPLEWCVARRVLDKRTPFIVSDNGMKLESRIHTENAAHAVLLVVDKPDIAAGKRYTVCDNDVYPIRQRIEFIADYLGHEFEFIDIPWEIGWPSHPLYRNIRGHSLVESSLIRKELGYTDPVPADTGMRRTVDWIMANRPEPGSELEQQIGDPFAYELEDELIERWQGAKQSLVDLKSPLPSEHRHMYRHPKQPGETWGRQRPESPGQIATTVLGEI